MVDSFPWQNISVPKGPSSVAKKVHLVPFLQLKKALLGPKHFAKGSCLPRVLRSITNKYLYIDVVMNLYSIIFHCVAVEVKSSL